MELSKTLQSIAGYLDKIQIPYLIIGGQAVLFYSEFRTTKDIDIVLGLDISKVDVILKAVKVLKFEILPENIDTFVKKNWVLPALDPKTGLQIDFIFSITDYEKEAIKRGINFKIGKTNIKFASVEDIIIHKLYAGRNIDMIDVDNLILKYNEHDKKYIRKWLKIFDKSSDTNLLKTYNGLLKKK